MRYGSRAAAAAVALVVFMLGLVAVGGLVAGGSAGSGAIVSCSPAEPRWGDTVVVTYDPGEPKAVFALDDEAFLVYSQPPRHEPQRLKLEREGAVLVGRVAVEEGASFLSINIVGRRRHDRNAALGVMAFRPDGKPAPDAWRQKLLFDFSPETQGCTKFRHWQWCVLGSASQNPGQILMKWWNFLISRAIWRVCWR